jgi:hypothetical protein
VTRPARIAILSHDEAWPEHSYNRTFVQTMVRELDAQFVDVDRAWPPVVSDIAGYRSLDAIVTFIRYRQLVVADPIDWRNFDGVRIQLEHDAYTDAVLAGPFKGTWARTFRRHQFDHLIVSGLRLVDHFDAQGVPTSWLPKGFDGDAMANLGRARTGVAHYGTLYRSRSAMLRALRRAGTPIPHYVIPYEHLNDRLNGLAGVVVCSIDARVRWGRVGRAMERRWPGSALELDAEIEPMIKTFEVAGAGCAPLLAPSPDLQPLGFSDGETALLWRDFDHLAELLRDVHCDSERLAAVGSAASELAHRRHTWKHRAIELSAIIDRVRRH